MLYVYLPPSSKFLLLHQPSWNFLTVLQVKNNNIQLSNAVFLKDINLLNTNSGALEGPPSGAPYPYRKLKETKQYVYDQNCMNAWLM